MNRLDGETSPYLRQHASNPVDWFPWGPDALERARRLDRPLFVSIGYASCHWCHVMAHESFEDGATGDDLNRWFVSVKVDREERPDLDAVYMAAVQAFSGSGGWPMSVFCTPDGRPFFAGTYFPPADRHGLPGFRHLLAALADAWHTRRDEVESQADALARAVAAEATLLDRLVAPEVGTSVSFAGLLERTVAQLAERFDPRWGGFGPAPKFPRPTLVELCLRHYHQTGRSASLTMAATTLDAMAAGGIYDHLAGGFARYSTDTRWLVPHFEKMLTDQALLARAYLHAWQVTGSDAYLQVASETLDYVVSDLTGPGGGLCSSEDADAGGVEGAHAVFTAAEVSRALTDAGRSDLVATASEWYGITDEGNWEGSTVLSRPLGAPLRRPEAVEEARRILLGARRRRAQPARDTKVILEWNAMAAAVLAEAAFVTGNRRWADHAVGTADLCFTGLRRDDGRWLRTLGSGQPAFAADYAWLLESCLRVSELTGEGRWLDRAVEVADSLLDLFADHETGGLFTTGDDAEVLLVRGKEWADGAVPSANAVGAEGLLHLGVLTGNDRYRDAGERIVELAMGLIASQPVAAADMVAAASWVDDPSDVVVAGNRPDLLAVVRRRWLPVTAVAWGDRRDSAIWEGKADGWAFVCRAGVCQAPAGDAGTLASQLELLAAGDGSHDGGEQKEV
ncbi:MAG: thioredoxin domain-containing protein [Acidimicrobiales bacterium]